MQINAGELLHIFKCAPQHTRCPELEVVNDAPFIYPKWFYREDDHCQSATQHKCQCKDSNDPKKF